MHSLEDCRRGAIVDQKTSKLVLIVAKRLGQWT